MHVRASVRSFAGACAVVTALGVLAAPTRASAASPMPTQDANLLGMGGGKGGQPPPPCHPNRNAARDREAVEPPAIAGVLTEQVCPTVRDLTDPPVETT